MLETREQDMLPFEEEITQLPEKLTKYNKRIDDLLEDAEIEAEMEAEKKIRSKNSRLFSISIIGIALLALVYFQVNDQSTVTQAEPTNVTSINKLENAEERLSKQVPVLEGDSSLSTSPILQSMSSIKNLENSFLTPPKTKETIPNDKEVKQAPQVIKSLSSPKTKSSSKKIQPATKNQSIKFNIQVGAFGIKKNAESLMEQLKRKGFSPLIKTRTKKVDQYIVTVGSFVNNNSGNVTLKNLSSKGFNASYFKNSKNSFSLKVGQHRNLKDAQKAQDHLSKKGFLSKTHKVEVPVDTYMVQLGVFTNRKKARITQEKLARSGFSKTFIR